jgi:hypothetical protein
MCYLEDLYKMYYSSNNKNLMMFNITCIREIINVYTIIVGKLERTNGLGDLDVDGG